MGDAVVQWTLWNGGYEGMRCAQSETVGYGLLRYV